MQNDCFPDGPSDWSKGAVSQLASINPRYAIDKTRDHPFIEMAAVAENFGGIQSFSWRKLEGSGLTRFKAADTLFAKITPCPENGKVAFVPSLPSEVGLGSTEFIVLSPKDTTEPRYLFHLVCSHDVRGRAAASMEGSTGRQRVPDDVFRVRLIVPMPPREEQAAIARVLDAVDTAITRTDDAIRIALELDHSLLHDLMENGPTPRRRGARKQTRPPNWTVKRLDEVADVGSGVTLGKDVSGFKSVELPYLRVANVQDGHLNLDEIKTVRVRADEANSFKLQSGDVLMTEGGDIDKLGRGTIWRGEIENCLHQNHVFRIRANRELLDPEFYALVVESDIAKRYFNRVAKRTTNLASTNKTQVRVFRFPVPPTIEEQQKVVEIMAACKAKVTALRAKALALTALKKALMHDLLTGKVRTTNLQATVQA